MCVSSIFGRIAQKSTENKEVNPCFLGDPPKSRFQDRVRAGGNRRSETGKSLMPLAQISDESL
jgi:hypothetical protein